jgi:hypothetical protein
MKTTHCQYSACRKRLPPNSDSRKRFCDDRCRLKANRLKRATERTDNVVPLSPQEAAQRDSSRHDDLRHVWRLLIDSVTAQGVLVPGSAGAPVAHPALRFIAQLDAQLLKHELHPSETDSGDDGSALLQAALKRAREIEEERYA